MIYRDLRPDDVRDVQVLIDGEWIPAALEAYRRDPDGTWRGFVRWTGPDLGQHIGWYVEAELRGSDDQDG